MIQEGSERKRSFIVSVHSYTIEVEITCTKMHKHDKQNNRRYLIIFRNLVICSITLKVQIFTRSNFGTNKFLRKLIFAILGIFAKFTKFSSRKIRIKMHFCEFRKNKFPQNIWKYKNREIRENLFLPILFSLLPGMGNKSMFLILIGHGNGPMWVIHHNVLV